MIVNDGNFELIVKKQVDINDFKNSYLNKKDTLNFSIATTVCRVDKQFII